MQSHKFTKKRLFAQTTQLRFFRPLRREHQVEPIFKLKPDKIGEKRKKYVFCFSYILPYFAIKEQQIS